MGEGLQGPKSHDPPARVVQLLQHQTRVAQPAAIGCASRRRPHGRQQSLRRNLSALAVNPAQSLSISCEPCAVSQH